MNIWRQESQVFHEVGWRACLRNAYDDFLKAIEQKTKI